MRAIILLLSLSLFVSLNAAQSEGWCIMGSGQNCQVCYNNRVYNHQCSGYKDEGCKLSHSGFDEGYCSACDIGYYNTSGSDYMYCQKVPADKVVENCSLYQLNNDRTITCQACGRGYMPQISINKCVISTQGPCDSLALLLVASRTYTCLQCPSKYYTVSKPVEGTSIVQKVCEASEYEGCMSGASPTACKDFCDYRLGYQAVGGNTCVKRQEVFLA